MNGVQQAIGAAPHLIQRQAAIRQALAVFICNPVPAVAARHVQVIAGRQSMPFMRKDVIVAPVGHYKALEAPFPAQNIGEKAFIGRAVLSIDLIKGGHDIHDLAGLYSHLKRFQIDLTQGPFGGNHVDGIPAGAILFRGIVDDAAAVILLVVSSKML